MRSNSTSLDLNDPSLPGANAGPYTPVQVYTCSRRHQLCYSLEIFPVSFCVNCKWIEPAMWSDGFTVHMRNFPVSNVFRLYCKVHLSPAGVGSVFVMWATQAAMVGAIGLSLQAEACNVSFSKPLQEIFLGWWVSCRWLRSKSARKMHLQQISCYQCLKMGLFLIDWDTNFLSRSSH